MRSTTDPQVENGRTRIGVVEKTVHHFQRRLRSVQNAQAGGCSVVGAALISAKLQMLSSMLKICPSLCHCGDDQKGAWLTTRRRRSWSLDQLQSADVEILKGEACFDACTNPRQADRYNGSDARTLAGERQSDAKDAALPTLVVGRSVTFLGLVPQQREEDPRWPST